MCAIKPLEVKKLNNPYRHNCNTCTNKCDGKSKGNYIFSNDVEFSEFFEKRLILKINNSDRFAQKTEIVGYPDVEVFKYKNGPLVCYTEVKAQRRTFMKVAEMLPESDLVASETVALNWSDLNRYFEIGREIDVPIYVLWVLAERPCVLGEKREMAFFQDLKVLEQIYNHYRDKRRFKRRSGFGDVVDGKHKGVVVNYHFSINELKAFTINQII